VPRTVLGRVAAGLVLAFTALAVLVRSGREVPGDGALARLSSGGGQSSLALGIDAVTGYAGTAALAGVVVLLLLRRGRRRGAVLCAVSVAGAMLSTTLLKHLVDRPRPGLLPPSVQVSELSFPSGHAAATAALAVTVVLALRGRRTRVVAAVLGTLLVLGTAAVQLLLVRHRASDVVGGWLWAAAWTTAVWAVSDRRRVR
jgi:undecaprenyl-diphosphatase